MALLFVCFVSLARIVMGRPTEVSDEEIIAVGLKLQAQGPINPTRLWVACGSRGRSTRLFEVWERYLRQTVASAAGQDTGPTSAAMPVPEAAHRLAAGLKGDLSTGIDRALEAIYVSIDDVVKGRYQAEFASLTSIREAHALEMLDAQAALEDMSDARERDLSRIAELKEALVTAHRDRDVGGALRGAAVEQHTAVLVRLQEAERRVDLERSVTTDLKVAAARAGLEMVALNRQRDEDEARLDAGKATLETRMVELLAAREEAGRQSEIIRQRDAEIDRIRLAFNQAEQANIVLMERAISAEHAAKVLATPAASPAQSSTAKAALRSRKAPHPRRLDIQIAERSALDQSAQLGSKSHNLEPVAVVVP
jgi:hypothetical protein